MMTIHPTRLASYPEQLGYVAIGSTLKQRCPMARSSIRMSFVTCMMKMMTMFMCVYVALDEGCNSTCHSSYWMSMAEKKFECLGCRIDCLSKDGKTFAGLGSRVVVSCRFPFDWMMKGPSSMAFCKSHQLTEGKSPMLLSLHAKKKKHI